MTNVDEDFSDESNGVISLICSITEFVQLFISNIVEEATKIIDSSDNQDSINVLL